MIISIDESAGFCWGVVRTVEIVEETLTKEDNVYIIGDIIHNPREIERLREKGLLTVKKDELSKIPFNARKVIIRAHGEPPSTYKLADELNLSIIDATCPLVQALQKRVKKYYDLGFQIVIFGKKEHSEVIGLRGVCNDECIVINSVEQAIEKIDFTKKLVLFSQTTMNQFTFNSIKEAIENKAKDILGNQYCDDFFVAKNTICKYVSDREEKIKQFAKENDIIIFAAGRNSSNGKTLYSLCKSVNKNSYFIEDTIEISKNWFHNTKKIGITGATSTPQWYLQKVRNEIENMLS